MANGIPCYPGIEVSWNSELAETYRQSSEDRFRVNDDKVKPGDLTKYLSLPWQSDLYECRSFWCALELKWHDTTNADFV